MCVGRKSLARALPLALMLSSCVPSHDEDLPNTLVNDDDDAARLRLLIHPEHQSGAHVVPVLIEAQRRAVTSSAHCVALVGFPGRLDVPLGADCPPSGASDASHPRANPSAVNVCMHIESSATLGWFEGSRIAAYHPSQREETFSAFAQLHGNPECAGTPLAEVAVVVQLGRPSPAAGDAGATPTEVDAAAHSPPPIADAETARPEAGARDGGNDGSL